MLRLHYARLMPAILFAAYAATLDVDSAICASALAV